MSDTRWWKTASKRFVPVSDTATTEGSGPMPVHPSTATGTTLVGTAGTAAAGVLSVQGIASGTALPVSGTVTATGPLTNAQAEAILGTAATAAVDGDAAGVAIAQLRGINKAQAASLTAVKNGDYVVSAAYRLTIAATALVKDIGGAVLPANAVGVVIKREEGSTGRIGMNIGGAASATTPEWPADGAAYPTTKASFDTVQLYAGTTQYATLFVLIPRN